MEIDKIEQMIYALDRIIERYVDSMASKQAFTSLLNEISNFYRNTLYPYCGHSMSKIIIRNELIENLGYAQAEVAYNQLF